MNAKQIRELKEQGIVAVIVRPYLPWEVQMGKGVIVCMCDDIGEADQIAHDLNIRLNIDMKVVEL